MDQESIVYGVIKDVPSSDQSFLIRSRLTNADAIMELPDDGEFPYLSSYMFSLPPTDPTLGTYHTQVIHFAASYKAIEYEWELWMEKFEHLLRQMVWVSATVHLETELSGKHVFSWEANGSYHDPGNSNFTVNCEWEHELALKP